MATREEFRQLLTLTLQVSSEKDKNYVKLDLDLKSILYPPRYRIFFYAYSLENNKSWLLDPVRWIYVPPPEFSMSTSPATLDITAGDKGTIELNVNSTTGFQPTVYLDIPYLPANIGVEYENGKSPGARSSRAAQRWNERMAGQPLATVVREAPAPDWRDRRAGPCAPVGASPRHGRPPAEIGADRGRVGPDGVGRRVAGFEGLEEPSQGRVDRGFGRYSPLTRPRPGPRRLRARPADRRFRRPGAGFRRPTLTWRRVPRRSVDVAAPSGVRGDHAGHAGSRGAGRRRRRVC